MTSRVCFQPFCYILVLIASCSMLAGSGLAQGRAEMSVGPLTGPLNGDVAIPVVIQRPGSVVGLQIDLEAIPGRLEVSGFEAGTAAAGLTLKSSLLGNGLTRLVLYSTTNAHLGEGEVIRVKGVRRSATPSLDRGLSIRAVTIADERGLLRQFAFSPFVEVKPRTASPAIGQPLIVDVVSFPDEGSSASVEVSVNGRKIASRTENSFSVTWTPIEPGVAFITASATSPAGSGSAIPAFVTVPGTPLNSFAGWRSFYFPTDPTSNDGPGSLLADPDRDLVPNIWEYAQGSNPSSIEGTLPHTETFLVGIGPDKFLALRLRMRAGTGDFEIGGECSSDLQYAPSVTKKALVVSREKAGEFEIITLRDIEPVGVEQKRFLRARLSPPTP